VTSVGTKAMSGILVGGTAANPVLSADTTVLATNTSVTAAVAGAVTATEGYANSTFLPLAGGTLTGVLNGTSSNFYGAGSFSGVLTASGGMVVDGQSPLVGDAPTALEVVGGTGGYASTGGGLTLSAGPGGGPAVEGAGGEGGSVVLNGGAGADGVAGIPDANGGNGGSITLQPGLGGTGPTGNGANGSVLLAPNGGRVGIGTSTPLYLFTVQGDDNGTGRGTPHQIVIQGNSNTNKQLLIGYFADSGSDHGYGTIQATVNDVTNTALVLNPIGGNVGIGTTTPDNTLSVNGSADKSGGGSWGTFSDARLKTVEGDFHSGLDQVLKLNPIVYRYKEQNALGIKDHDQHIGFVAQDVEKVVPEAVSKDAQGYRIVNNDPILWAMLNAIKEQQSLIRKQQGQTQAQRAEVQKLTEAHAADQAQIAKLQSQVAEQRQQARAQQAAITQLLAQVHSIQVTLASDRSMRARPRVAKTAADKATKAGVKHASGQAAPSLVAKVRF